MSDFTILDENDKYFPRIVKRINDQYAIWVKDLMLEDNNFNNEINDLKRKIDQKKTRQICWFSMEVPLSDFGKI